MGWLTNVKDWGKRILRYDTTKAVANYSYTTIEHMFEQVAAAPKVVRSIIVHPPTRTVAKHLMHISEDIGLIVIVVLGNHCLQTYGRERLEDEPNDSWISTYTAIQSTLYLMQALTWVYCKHKKIERKTRTIVASVEAPFLLNDVKDQPGSLVCEKVKCSDVEFATGSVINNVAYWATEGAIALVGYIPMAGGPIAAGLSVYHNGRYALDAALPKLCNDHKLRYLQKQSELALAIGLMHLVITSLANSFIATAGGAIVPPVYAWLSNAPLDMEKILPRDTFSSAVAELTLIAQISVAAHLNLPEVDYKTSRTLPDPVWVYQHVVGFGFETMMWGLTITIPRMLKGRTPKNIKDVIAYLPWSTIFNYSSMVHNNGVVRIFLPKLLHDRRSFIEDPIVRSNWPKLQATIISGLRVIETLNSHPIVGPALVQLKRLKNNNDHSTTYGAYPTAYATVNTFLKTCYGTPDYVNKQLIELILDEEVEDKLREWRYVIEELSLDKPLAITVDDSALLLQGQAPKTTKDSLAVLPEGSTRPLATAVIKRDQQPSTALRDSTSLPRAGDVIRRSRKDSTQLATNSESVDPNKVIRRRLCLLGNQVHQNVKEDGDENDWQEVPDHLSFG